MRLITLHKMGHKNSGIVKVFKNEGIIISISGVRKILKKYKTHGRILDFQKTGRKTKTSTEVWDYIDEIYVQNDELTAVDVQKKLIIKFGLHLSIPSIKRLRKKLGWRKTGPRYCQAIRPINCVKRLEFAELSLENDETFDDVVFTDESSIHIKRHSNIAFRKKGMPGKLKPKVKHPYKVHVWGGISRNGRTQLVIFTGIMRKVCRILLNFKPVFYLSNS